jgi:hypothetical protein
VLDHSDHLEGLDQATKAVLDTIVRQQDVFNAMHNKQIFLMGTLHSETLLGIKDEHATTRHEIISETAFNIQAGHALTCKMVREIWVRALFVYAATVTSTASIRRLQCLTR